MDVEEDVFFAHISKRIALLILDDEDDGFIPDCPSANLQAFSDSVVHPMPPSVIPYEQGCRSKGTGVFIPRCSVPRRKNRSTKSISQKNNNLHNQQQQQPDKSRTVHHASNGDRSGLPCYNNSKWLK
ncbi:hypothetical protein QJS04_geneDACA022826 [Acorus gramineus]|uniref:Uncharacterized protein n=1 Tax=Acorus gramineus TaxID=55184 RepID=A0AAV9BQR9_ACOGR|nr:hypothetical protein QJS04_geneDACA022826 [Acorus gramineus]